ncbi:MAG: TetR/AcrR family transcriptional regulator [Bacteroidales bacterium]|nr:TetR/AcrR family transcriptional regulator [Bacteroidales bacterium]
MSNLVDCEVKIIHSAKQVFIEKGFEKAKMQEIAERAGISRTNLNYYFRTKENLFYSIVEQIFDSLIPRFELVLHKQAQNHIERFENIVDVYTDFLRINSDIPFFVISEINRNPKLIVGFIKESNKINTYLEVLKQLLGSALKPNQVNYFMQMPIEELLTIVYGMLFMPHIIEPLVKELYDGDEKRIADYYDHHSLNVKFILRKLLTDN